MVRWSSYFLPTLREVPKDAESASHQLMLRAGLIRRLGAGAYSYLPLGFRALQRAAAIVREEMMGAGAQELLMPALQPVELWKTTGRDDALGDVLIRFKDRTGKDLALGPTHEEVVTTLLSEVKSHRQLPMIVYQIQTKFRDEPRPRFGVIRSKEFLMKDAYSFDVTAEGLNRSYQAMYEAYERIFARCGLSVLACEADPGIMGGDLSHEFMAPAVSGEDRVVRCGGCGYAANMEAAKCPAPGPRPPAPELPKPLESVKTPGAHTVQDVSRLLKVSRTQLIKTLVYEGGDRPVAVLVRGDHDVNEAKLARVTRTPNLQLASAAAIERLTGAPMGFTGPVKLRGARLIADHAAMAVVNGVTGANAADAHLINVNPGRDFTPEVVGDVRVVTPKDPCPACGRALELITAIELGHVFQLGTKYSQALGAMVQGADGRVTPMVMGCYGIGINRILAAAVEQSHDEAGIRWPPGLAPFDAVVSVLDAESPEPRRAGEEAARALERAGRAVLLDDRAQSAGSKLKDADLIGVPVRVVVGTRWATRHTYEVSRRGRADREDVSLDQLAAATDTLLGG